MPEKEYQRLTRARSRSAFAVAFASRSSLWLGRDHLLGVDSNGYTETYKRFYFRDLQAITLVATKRRTVWNGLLLVPIVVCLAGLANALFSVPGQGRTAIFSWATVMAFFALGMLVNNLLGPTCTCYLRTAVQIEELPSLNRLRRARKVLARIRPFISAAQDRHSTAEPSSRTPDTAGIPGAPPAAT